MLEKKIVNIEEFSGGLDGQLTSEGVAQLMSGGDLGYIALQGKAIGTLMRLMKKLPALYIRKGDNFIEVAEIIPSETDYVTFTAACSGGHVWECKELYIKLSLRGVRIAKAVHSSELNIEKIVTNEFLKESDDKDKTSQRVKEVLESELGTLKERMFRGGPSHLEKSTSCLARAIFHLFLAQPELRTSVPGSLFYAEVEELNNNILDILGLAVSKLEKVRFLEEKGAIVKHTDDSEFHCDLLNYVMPFKQDEKGKEDGGR